MISNYPLTETATIRRQDGDLRQDVSTCRARVINARLYVESIDGIDVRRGDFVEIDGSNYTVTDITLGAEDSPGFVHLERIPDHVQAAPR